MFNPQASQPDAAEVRAGELEAAASVRNFAIGCVVLWFSPHIVAYVKNLL